MNAGGVAGMSLVIELLYCTAVTGMIYMVALLYSYGSFFISTADIAV